ncbi:MAG TPA: hypothetical protein PLF32_00335 [Bacteroidales bacterium]|jgi:uncharacterized protein involved in exopolysaccharide biosynthesis|nr:hypothetical protein [Bacteroidales bacterium]HOR81087.1 hypothetical protein [Bacteroidales bacterium]HPJ91926.1 hypothetical protein [Bacteroidales bacterium]HPX59464.1 hypothetical protein [Bacteroidales bacterium]
MKKLIFLTTIALSFLFLFLACNTYERCPAYTDLQIETTQSSKV